MHDVFIEKSLIFIAFNMFCLLGTFMRVCNLISFRVLLVVIGFMFLVSIPIPIVYPPFIFT